MGDDINQTRREAAAVASSSRAPPLARYRKHRDASSGRAKNRVLRSKNIPPNGSRRSVKNKTFFPTEIRKNRPISFNKCPLSIVVSAVPQKFCQTCSTAYSQRHKHTSHLIQYSNSYCCNEPSRAKGGGSSAAARRLWRWWH